MKIYKVLLYPGDSLLIPPWVWHATEGHDINLSITEIYHRTDLSYLWNYPDLILDYLSDRLGYYIYDEEIRILVRGKIPRCLEPYFAFILLLVLIIVLLPIFFKIEQWRWILIFWITCFLKYDWVLFLEKYP